MQGSFVSSPLARYRTTNICGMATGTKDPCSHVGRWGQYKMYSTIASSPSIFSADLKSLNQKDKVVYEAYVVSNKLLRL
jgi:hypothetical protein